MSDIVHLVHTDKIGFIHHQYLKILFYDRCVKYAHTATMQAKGKGTEWDGQLERLNKNMK